MSTFTYNEAALAMTTLVAWANGELNDSQVDTRVQMILDEGITQTEIDEFQEKYDALPDEKAVYELALKAIMKEDDATRARICSWMWEVANVSTIRKYKEVDLSYLEEETEWVSNSQYVDVEELRLINKTRKDLGIKLDNFKASFSELPKSKRI